MRHVLFDSFLQLFSGCMAFPIGSHIILFLEVVLPEYVKTDTLMGRNNRALKSCESVVTVFSCIVLGLAPYPFYRIEFTMVFRQKDASMASGFENSFNKTLFILKIVHFAQNHSHLFSGESRNIYSSFS